MLAVVEGVAVSGGVVVDVVVPNGGYICTSTILKRKTTQNRYRQDFRRIVSHHELTFTSAHTIAPRMIEV